MSEKSFPKHIAFIMDGNGRWATKRHKARSLGHVAGYETLQKIISYAYKIGVETVSFYAFSTENWSRSKEEVNKLLSLMAKALKYALKKLCEEKIRFVISGDYSVVKPRVKRDIEQLIEKTSSFSPYTLNICFNYGSRAEIVNAVNNMINDGVRKCDEALLSKYLYTKDLPDPELIVRTSGEQRLSNFMMWQASYSELYFTDTLWPDFDEKELDKAIDWYLKRDRRFGKS